LFLAGKILLLAKEFLRGADGWCEAEEQAEVAEAALGRGLLFAANSCSRKCLIIQISGEIKQDFLCWFILLYSRAASFVAFCKGKGEEIPIKISRNERNRLEARLPRQAGMPVLHSHNFMRGSIA
jgi:hypothetical protein